IKRRDVRWILWYTGPAGQGKRGRTGMSVSPRERRTPMKSVVIYESVYGNTRTIAEASAAALPGEVKLQNVTGASVAGLEAGDLLVVGAPTHGGRPTETTQGFLDQLPANSLAGIRV